MIDFALWRKEKKGLKLRKKKKKNFGVKDEMYTDLLFEIHKHLRLNFFRK